MRDELKQVQAAIVRAIQNPLIPADARAALGSLSVLLEKMVSQLERETR